MHRLPTFALTLAALVPLVCGCRSAAENVASPGAVRAGFHFAPGEKFQMRVTSRFEIAELALGVEEKGLFLKGRQSGVFEIEIEKADKDDIRAKLTPVSFDIGHGEGSLSYKNGKLERSKEAEEREFSFPTGPCEMTLGDDGAALDMKPQGAWMFFGYMFSHPPSLLGWLGPLPSEELREGLEWTNPRQVMLAREDAMPMNAVARSVRKTSSGWIVNLTVGVDRTSSLYVWLKTCAESGLGFIILDAQGRPERATVSWTARSPQGKPIGEYSWSCDYVR